MPSSKLVVSQKYVETFRTSKVVGMFDVPVVKEISKEWEIDIPIENVDWNIGLIVGSSGSGKSTIAKNFFKGYNYFNGFEWPKNKSILDGFKKDLDVKIIVESLSKVGFSSPPAWLLPYDKLSNGQKFRTDVARNILENDNVIFDEFTSVVDRQVAKIGCAAVQKFIKKMNKKFIAVSCHHDIIEWLEPDWVYDVDSGQFKMTRGLLRRPEIKTEIFECHRKIWKMFKGHHYLSADISNSCKVFGMFMNDVPIGMCAVLPFPHQHLKNVYKEHRTVILPDYQGIGLGNRLSECVGDIMKEKGKKFYSTTSHPAMINYRKKSDKWRMIRKPSYMTKQGKNSGITGFSKTLSTNRLTASFEYVR